MLLQFKTHLKLALVSSLAIITGCNSTTVSNQNVGTAVGAVAGGVIGNQFGGGSGRTVATVVGALAGGVIGNGIGTQLDNNTRQAALAAEYNALENGQPGQPIRWQGTNGTHGQVVPQQTYQVGSQNCRRYTQTIFIDGQPQQGTGTACRNADGTWTPLT